MIKVPFSIIPIRVLKKHARIFLPLVQKFKFIYLPLTNQLKQAEFDVDGRDYLAMCLYSTSMFFIFITLLLILNLYLITKRPDAILLSFLISLFISFFVLFSQLYYPKLIANKRIRGLERNLLPALQNLLVQLNAGVPLFNALVSLSKGVYGELSLEFEKVVKKINAGIPEVEALEDIASNNPSLFFRRAIWQLVNGIKSGSDISRVLTEIINSLSAEQLIQIQQYGSRLNPLAMFYMLVVVVIPSLSITFIIIISSFIGLSESASKFVLWGLYAFVLFFQIIFQGLMKSRRPNLLT